MFGSFFRLIVPFLVQNKREMNTLLIHASALQIVQAVQAVASPSFHAVFIYRISKQNWKLTPDWWSQHSAIEFRTRKHNTQPNIWINWFHFFEWRQFVYLTEAITPSALLPPGINVTRIAHSKWKSNRTERLDL